MNPIRNKRAPKHTTRFIGAKAGSPKSREAQGDGTPIRVSHKNRAVPKGNKGAAHEDGPECVSDTHTKGRYQEVSKAWRYAKLQTTEALLGLLRERGKRGLPLNRIYRQLYNTNLYLTAYGRVYRNAGSMTPGVTEETADGTSLETFETITQALRQERYQWQPARRIYIPKKNGATRFLQTVISRGTRSGVFLFGKTLTTNLLTLGAIPNQSNERLITHPSCSDWSSIRKAG